jgi:hypothetical protein
MYRIAAAAWGESRASRGPPLGAAHPARYPTVRRFILEDWAGQDGIRLSFCRQAHLFPKIMAIVVCITSRISNIAESGETSKVVKSSLFVAQNLPFSPQNHPRLVAPRVFLLHSAGRLGGRALYVHLLRQGDASTRPKKGISTFSALILAK